MSTQNKAENFGTSMTKRLMIVFGFLLLSCCYGIAQVPRQQFVIRIPYIECKSGTEINPDDIYMVVCWRTSFGSTGTVRLPYSERQMGEGTYLSIEDLYGWNLAPGESIDFVITILDEDNGDASQYVRMGSQVVNNLPQDNIVVMGLQGLLQIGGIIGNVYDKINTDDWIGSMYFKVVHNGGTYSVSSGGIYNRNSNHNGYNRAEQVSANETQFQFAGDGSYYIVRTQIFTR